MLVYIMYIISNMWQVQFTFARPEDWLTLGICVDGESEVNWMGGDSKYHLDCLFTVYHYVLWIDMNSGMVSWWYIIMNHSVWWCIMVFWWSLSWIIVYDGISWYLGDLEEWHNGSQRLSWKIGYPDWRLEEFRSVQQIHGKLPCPMLSAF